MSKKSGEPSASKAGSSSVDQAGEASSADLKKAPGVKKLANQPQASRARQEQIADGRNALQQIQSQEKKAGDRQSVPNIEDTITVQLESEVTPNAAVKETDELICKQLDSVVINTSVDDQ